MGCCNAIAELEEKKIEQALIKTLEHSARHAAGSCSQEGGFSGNEEIRIKAPGEIGEFLAKVQELPGFGDEVKNFEDGLNRAAEKAAGDALDILMKALGLLTFTEVKKILFGPDNACTEFFKSSSRSALHADFKSVIEEALNHYTVITMYEKMAEAFAAIPLIGGKAPEFDFSEYVTEKALDGLFVLLAQKELQIRNDPEARKVEAILEEVFGHQSFKDHKANGGGQANNEPTA